MPTGTSSTSAVTLPEAAAYFLPTGAQLSPQRTRQPALVCAPATKAALLCFSENSADETWNSRLQAHHNRFISIPLQRDDNMNLFVGVFELFDLFWLVQTYFFIVTAGVKMQLFSSLSWCFSPVSSHLRPISPALPGYLRAFLLVLCLDFICKLGFLLSSSSLSFACCGLNIFTPGFALRTYFFRLYAAQIWVSRHKWCDITLSNNTGTLLYMVLSGAEVGCFCALSLIRDTNHSEWWKWEIRWIRMASKAVFLPH